MALGMFGGKLQTRNGKLVADLACCCPSGLGCCANQLGTFPNANDMLARVTNRSNGCATVYTAGPPPAGQELTLTSSSAGIWFSGAWAALDDSSNGILEDEWYGLEAVCTEDNGVDTLGLFWQPNLGYGQAPTVDTSPTGNLRWTLVTGRCDPFEWVYRYTIADILGSSPSGLTPCLGDTGFIEVTLTLAPP